MFFYYFYVTCISGVLQKSENQKVKIMYDKEFTRAFLYDIWKNISDMF